MVAPAGFRGTLSQLAPMAVLPISSTVSGEVGIVPATLLSIVPMTRRPAPLLKVTLERFWLFLLKPMMPLLLTVTRGVAPAPRPFAVFRCRAPPLTITALVQLLASAVRNNELEPF